MLVDVVLECARVNSLPRVAGLLDLLLELAHACDVLALLVLDDLVDEFVADLLGDQLEVAAVHLLHDVGLVPQLKLSAAVDDSFQVLTQDRLLVPSTQDLPCQLPLHSAHALVPDDRLLHEGLESGKLDNVVSDNLVRSKVAKLAHAGQRVAESSAAENYRARDQHVGDLLAHSGKFPLALHLPLVLKVEVRVTEQFSLILPASLVERERVSVQGLEEEALQSARHLVFKL